MSERNSANFFTILKKYKVVFNKSQLPSVRIRKDAALVALRDDYVRKFGREITLTQLKKKIQNVKNEVKKRRNVRATVKEDITLKNWQQELLNIMAQENNAVCTKIPGALEIGFSCERQNTPVFKTPRKALNTENQEIDNETEETKNLTNAQLQRLVLLRQLKLLNMKISEREEKIKSNEIRKDEIQRNRTRKN